MLYMKGDGTVIEHVGNYEELYAKYIAPALKNNQSRPKISENTKNIAVISNNKEAKSASKTKLSYKDQRLYEVLPGEIEQLEKDIAEIERELSDTELFLQDENKFYQLSRKLENLKKEKDEKENKWLEIDEIKSLL